MFFIARAKGRYDLIDVAWGLTFIGIALVSYAGQVSLQILSVQTLVTALVIIWGIRLSWHIYARWSRTRGEDKRYAAMRTQYKKKLGGVDGTMYVRVFVVQALLALVISAPVLVVNTSEPLALTWLSLTGALVWGMGFFFEAVGDYQLKSYLASQPKKPPLMTTGLWKYTRHPNYFGEVTQWWGIFVIATMAPLGLIALVGPLVITILILFVSGVPLTEKHFEGRPGWAAYKRRTSSFLPLPPKKV